MKTKNLIRQRKIEYILLFTILFCGYFFLRSSSWVGNKQLHTLMEVVATLLSSIVGVLALVRYYTKKNNAILFIGTGFLGTAFLDGYHAIVTSTFFEQLWPSPPESLIPWSWNASRTFLSILMCLSWWAWRREEKLGDRGKFNEKGVYIGIGLFAFISFLFFFLYPLPRAYYPEFIFGRPEEFVSAFFFLLALIGYLKKGEWKHEDLEHWLVLSLIVGFMGQVMFMPFSFRLFDMMFDAAHTLKKVSYLCTLTGLLISMFVVFRQAEKDKGDLQMANKELVESEKELRSLDEMKTNFLSTVSHELRTPLTSILGNNKLIVQKYKTMPDEDKLQFLDVAIRQGEHLLNLVNDILDVAKAEAGHLKVNRTIVDLENIIHNSMEQVQILADKKNITLKQEILTKETEIFADYNRLQQILINLLSNAIKFSSEEKSIVIKVEDYVHSSKVLLIAVKDEGIGIPKDKISLLFNRFAQIDNSPTRKAGGTGLGLSIVKELVHLHGGKIWVESKEGKGTTFFFTILKADQKKKG